MKIGFIAFVFMLLLSHLARANSFEFLNGTYDMKIQIGETSFNDILELKTSELNFQSANISGTVAVPGSFTSALTGTIFYGVWAGVYLFDFSILATEGGTEYIVKYVGTMSVATRDQIQGSAYHEDGALLGNFVAVKRR